MKGEKREKIISIVDEFLDDLDVSKDKCDQISDLITQEINDLEHDLSSIVTTFEDVSGLESLGLIEDGVRDLNKIVEQLY